MPLSFMSQGLELLKIFHYCQIPLLIIRYYGIWLFSILKLLEPETFSLPYLILSSFPCLLFYANVFCTYELLILHGVRYGYIL